MQRWRKPVKKAPWIIERRERERERKRGGRAINVAEKIASRNVVDRRSSILLIYRVTFPR
jgi:hypothetical protein